MRLTLTCLLAAAVVPTAILAAQGTTSGASRTEGEVYAGWTSAQVHVSDNGQSDTSPSVHGYALGAGAILPASAKVGIEVIAGYVRLSQDESDGAGGSESESENYATIAALARPVFHAGNTTPFLLVGPHLTYAISCSLSVGDCSLDGETRSDFGIVAGAGIGYRRFFVEGRYDFGISNVAPQNLTGISEKTRTIFLGAGVTF